VTAQPAGAYRRTAVERSDQRIAWERADQAFFASGACHILAWTCQRHYPDRPVRLSAMRFTDQPRVFHVYAAWETWAFDHSGWNAEADLLSANAEFEGRAIEQIDVSTSLNTFCAEHYHRMPDHYWRDPIPRAVEYVERYAPPWMSTTTRKC
jgi:hypothetical protein